VLLTPEKMTISNIPDILDVNLLIELLGEMGVKTDRISRDTCIFQADDDRYRLPARRSLSHARAAS
jgi:UDP-N-acetylglucosamine 1-carboxyvinyltransferase